MFEGSVEPGADRAGRAVERVRDLDVGKPDVEPQHDHGALVERQTVEQIGDRSESHTARSGRR